MTLDEAQALVEKIFKEISSIRPYVSNSEYHPWFAVHGEKGFKTGVEAIAHARAHAPNEYFTIGSYGSEWEWYWPSMNHAREMILRCARTDEGEIK